MDINITKGDTSKRLSDIGVNAKDFVVSSIEIEVDKDKLEGRDGYRDNGATFGERTIVVPFYFEAHDLLDVPLLRDDLFRLVLDKRPFYIQEMRRAHRQSYPFVRPDEPAPAIVDNHELFQKRYKVRLANVFEIEQMLNFGEGELVFVTVDSPFAESVGTTQSELTFPAEAWQIGQGLMFDECKYIHSTKFFSIYNAGDITLDPIDYPMTIGYFGPSNNLEIYNETTGDVWKYTGSSTEGEMITLEGVRSLKNGDSIFPDTNMKLITLAPGWNDFALSGTTGEFLISFDHRFYYY